MRRTEEEHSEVLKHVLISSNGEEEAPDTNDYETIVRTIVKLGYKLHSGFGYIHPEQKSWIFDMFARQRVFVTDLYWIPSKIREDTE